jgi:hypothetical protein
VIGRCGILPFNFLNSLKENEENSEENENLTEISLGKNRRKKFASTCNLHNY